MDRIRTEPSEDFKHGGLPVERFARVARVERPDPGAWAQQQFEHAQRQEFTPLGQISQIWLGDRDIDFGAHGGPLLGANRQKQLIIASPVYQLPPRRVLMDKRGRPLWNVEKYDERTRARMLAGSRVEMQSLRVEAYASGIHSGYHVLKPLTQILFRTADASKHLMYVNFHPSADGHSALLLYDAKSGQLALWGGGAYTFA